MEDVYEILPFENALCVLTLRGADLRHLFENIAARGGEGVSGVRLTISADGRLLDCSVGGLPVDEERTYTVATLDYLAEGNDGMDGPDSRHPPPMSTGSHAARPLHAVRKSNALHKAGRWRHTPRGASP